MEMQVITLEEEGAAVEATATRGKVLKTEAEVSEAAEKSETVLNTEVKEESEVAAKSEKGLKTEGKEETEAAVYSTLGTPTEDIYATAGQPLIKHQTAQQNLGKERLYRGLCILLSIICLILVLVIFVLYLKLSTEKQDGGVVSQTGGCIHGSGCQNQCPQDWLPFDSFCFYLSKIRLNWQQSRKECQAKGGDLAIINQQKVQEFLTCQGKRMYWIGLSYIERQWTWVNNTALVTRYFADGNKWATGNCSILTAGDPPEKSWSLSPCSYHTYFICQRDN